MIRMQTTYGEYSYIYLFILFIYLFNYDWTQLQVTPS